MEEHTTTLPVGTMEEAWGLASLGSEEARRKVHSQPQPCLDLRAGRGGGEARIASSDYWTLFSFVASQTLHNSKKFK